MIPNKISIKCLLEYPLSTSFLLFTIPLRRVGYLWYTVAMKSSAQGFTLVELMVVISTIAMFASLLMVSVSTAQAKGRDSVRTQEVHQIDLATRLYASNNDGEAPQLNGCQAEAKPTPSFADASACVGVSSANSSSPQGIAWSEYKKALIPSYIANIPDDPCSSCATGSDYQPGYTYVAPLAMKYACQQDNDGTCPLSDATLDESYQIYASLEQQSVPVGVSSTVNAFVSYTTPVGVTHLLTLVAQGYTSVSVSVPAGFTPASCTSTTFATSNCIAVFVVPPAGLPMTVTASHADSDRSHNISVTVPGSQPFSSPNITDPSVSTSTVMTGDIEVMSSLDAGGSTM